MAAYDGRTVVFTNSDSAAIDGPFLITTVTFTCTSAAGSVTLRAEKTGGGNIHDIVTLAAPANGSATVTLDEFPAQRLSVDAALAAGETLSVNVR